MKASTTLHRRAEQYLAERRRLGFVLRTPACSLRSFVRHIEVVGHHGPLTIEVMTNWARRDSHGSDDPHTWARRLKHLRSFARWLRQFEPLTEIPDHTVFGRIDERQAPHIYSEREIVDLLAAARSGIGTARGRLRDIVRSGCQLRTAYQRGARIAQR